MSQTVKTIERDVWVEGDETPGGLGLFRPLDRECVLGVCGVETVGAPGIGCDTFDLLLVHDWRLGYDHPRRLPLPLDDADLKPDVGLIWFKSGFSPLTLRRKLTELLVLIHEWGWWSLFFIFFFLGFAGGDLVILGGVFSGTGLAAANVKSWYDENIIKVHNTYHYHGRMVQCSNNPGYRMSNS